PQTVKMLANRYIDEGGKFNYPDTYVYALCGDISNAVKSAEKDKNELDEHEKYYVYRFAVLFGTVEEYKKLKEIFNLEDGTRNNYGELTASCSIEMLEYLLEVNGEDIKFDSGIDDADSFAGFDYERIANGFDTAIKYGRYDMCKYYIDHGVKPNSSLTNYPAITSAINSGDYELFRLVYDYIKEEYGIPDEEVFGWCFGLSDLTGDKKKIIDFLFDEGYTFEKAHYNWLNDDVAEYLISHGAVITDEIVNTIGEYNYKNALKAVIDRGYEISPQSLSGIVMHAPSDMVEMVLDSGTEMEDTIMNKCIFASKATTKLLIERGANLNPEFVKDYYQWGSYDGENFTLKRFYEKYCRDDLVELLKEYE
ncbi:MAG: hypothetical protein NC177_17980, partial [Ruminococcus flavefaciens]|nr:hypothetical protein [Ruminococcus flavefaciens]